MLLLFLIIIAEWPLIWKIDVHLFSVRVLRGRLSVCGCASFPLGFEGGM